MKLGVECWGNIGGGAYEKRARDVIMPIMHYFGGLLLRSAVHRPLPAVPAITPKRATLRLSGQLVVEWVVAHLTLLIYTSPAYEPLSRTD